VKELLDAGVDVNTKFRYDRMALSFAADRGHVEVVKLLVERGADLNAKDTFYNATALTWAVNPAMGRTPQHADVVKLLLQRGAQGKDQALMGALGDAATVKAILEVGGLSAGTLSDALEAATRRKNQEMVTLLEQAGAKPRPEFKMDAAQLARLFYGCRWLRACSSGRREYRRTQYGHGNPNSHVPRCTPGRTRARPGQFSGRTRCSAPV
jgi:hypothetical protein